ncbi:MAG: hypothetical protein C5B48_03910 [Candidatus Rokuibacteriota bacterium]|nr:MAG: hypothetical protein C5B48_03910 [Candidatus Rokubacteria bacterium]
MVVVLLLIAGLAATALSACSDSSDKAAADEPASVEPIKGTNYNTIKLSPEAAKRLGIETAAISESHGREVVPYTAISYTPSGGTFVYVSPKALEFVRRPVTVKTVRKGEAILSHGPPVGTAVVTVGSPELFGAEYEFEPE